MRQWWIGCSGFHYKDWKGRFYPEGLPARSWFEYYCQHFNTVELNVTFYRFPQSGLLKNLYDRSPEKFKFSIKAPRLITHYRKFNDAKRLVEDFYETAGNGLQEKLGCVLFQMHPNMQYSPEKFAQIMDCLDLSFHNVLEFRHVSWWHPEVMETLRHHHITFCGISYPGLPDELHQTSKVMYYRFHGVPDLYRSSYTHDFMERVYSKLAQLPVDDSYVYFNNDYDGVAIHNGKIMQQLAGPIKDNPPKNTSSRKIHGIANLY